MHGTDSSQVGVCARNGSTTNTQQSTTEPAASTTQLRAEGMRRKLGDRLVCMIPSQKHAFACIDRVESGFELRCFDIQWRANDYNKSSNSSKKNKPDDTTDAHAPTASPVSFHVASCTPLALQQTAMAELSLSTGSTTARRGVPWPAAVVTALGADTDNDSGSGDRDSSAPHARDESNEGKGGVLVLKGDGTLCAPGGRAVQGLGSVGKITRVATGS